MKILLHSKLVVASKNVFMKNNNFINFSAFCAVFFCIAIFSCEEKIDNNIVIFTSEVSNVTFYSVTCGGVISSDGGELITNRGVCWSISQNPTVSLNTKTSDGTNVGSFTSSITGLQPSTTYYVRAYATNSVGTAYGNEVSFKTLDRVKEQINISFVDIPAGTFIMGSPTSEPGGGRLTDESQFQVTLSAFRMSKYEVTNLQYAAFLNNMGIGSDGKFPEGQYPAEILIEASSGYSWNWGINYVNNQWVPVPGYENHPVILVSWFGAKEFAKYVGADLPTEAQWEYACRAGFTTAFNTGDCLTNTQANYRWAYPQTGCSNSMTTSPNSTQEVGSYPANAWGLHDMHGNVDEWCNDWHGNYPTSDQTNPTGPATGLCRVYRGGSFDSSASFCRSANRNGYGPDMCFAILGFRLVVVPSFNR
jgi:formylglycine-generating enzyme required for sulfatase activity